MTAYEKAGFVIGQIAGIIVFIGCYIFCIASGGFLFGLGLGWLPSAICAGIAIAVFRYLWPLVFGAIGLIILLVIADRTSSSISKTEDGWTYSSSPLPPEKQVADGSGHQWRITDSPVDLDAKDDPRTKYANVTCLKVGEAQSGMNKICYYNCPPANSAMIITVPFTSLCPAYVNQN